jgi:hypothetical protein
MHQFRASGYEREATARHATAGGSVSGGGWGANRHYMEMIGPPRVPRVTPGHYQRTSPESSSTASTIPALVAPRALNAATDEPSQRRSKRTSGSDLSRS